MAKTLKFPGLTGSFAWSSIVVRPLRLDRQRLRLASLCLPMWQTVQLFPPSMVPAEIASSVAYNPVADSGDSSTSSYLKDREGPSVCSLISPTRSSVLPDMTVLADPSLGHQTVDVIADVAVRGGKWYFEVRSHVLHAPVVSCVSLG